MPLLNEAMFAVMEGVATPEAVDQVFQMGMAHPMGPLTLADFIGLDVCLDIMRVMEEGLGDPKYRPCPMLIRMVDAGGWAVKPDAALPLLSPLPHSDRSPGLPRVAPLGSDIRSLINSQGAYAFRMMRMTVLASGSKGNSTLVSSSRTRILVDAGLSAGNCSSGCKWRMRIRRPSMLC